TGVQDLADPLLLARAPAGCTQLRERAGSLGGTGLGFRGAPLLPIQLGPSGVALRVEQAVTAGLERPREGDAGLVVVRHREGGQPEYAPCFGRAIGIAEAVEGAQSALRR